MDIHLNRIDNKTTVTPRKNPTDKSAAPSTRPAGGGEVGASLKLTSLTASLESVPVVDNSKVKQVSNALQSGNYQVDVQRLAAKIVSFEKDLP